MRIMLGDIQKLPFGRGQRSHSCCHISIVGYNFWRRTLASAVRNCQLMPFWAAWRASVQAVTCAWAAFCVAICGDRACRVRTLSSGSALWSQRPCRGVNTRWTRGARRRASAGGNARKKRGVRVGVQMVADPGQALGVAVARMIREGLDLVRPVHGRAPRGSVGRAPRAQRFHEHPDRAGTVPHVFIVVGGRMSRTRRLRRPLVAPQRFGLFVHADHRIARIIGPAIEVQHPFHRHHERFVWHGRIAARHTIT